MVYPLLPLFLTQVLGAGAMSLGVIEGAAEARQQRAEDRVGLAGGPIGARRRSSCSPATGWRRLVRPLIALVDGVAAGARDSLRRSARQGDSRRAARRDAGALRARRRRAAASSASTARMDHAGAVTGPLLATAFLYFYPGALSIALRSDARSRDHRHSVHSAGPGAGVDRARRTATSDRIRPTHRTPAPTSAHPVRTLAAVSTSRWPSFCCSRSATRATRSSCCGSSDLGVAAVWIPLLWSALHVVKVTSSLVGGALSDRFGRRAHDRARLAVVRARLCRRSAGSTRCRS